VSDTCSEEEADEAEDGPDFAEATVTPAVFSFDFGCGVCDAFLEAGEGGYRQSTFDAEREVILELRGIGILSDASFRFRILSSVKAALGRPLATAALDVAVLTECPVLRRRVC
jgi:hypothetical protein